MKSLKDLRMTLKDRPSSGSRSPSISIGGTKHASSLQPPKQVIRAAMGYESQSPSELSFHRGDFFHVVASQKPGLRPGWIEACNPMTNARGLVPESHFDILQRSSPATAFNLTGRSELNPNGILPGSSSRSRPPSASSPSSWFATVKHDFFAERSQELDAKEGDSLLVVARSDMDWLVAKPLGRLGLPGLIPIGFIVFRDTVTGEPISGTASQSIVDQLPTVQEWQEKNERYHRNAIPLGRFETASIEPTALTKTRDSPLPPIPGDHVANTDTMSQRRSFSPRNSSTLDDPSATTHDTTLPHMYPHSPVYSNSRNSRSSPTDQSLTQSMYFLPAGLMISASVDAFHYEPNDYWYRLRVSYVSTLSSADAPDKPQGHEVRELVLYRLYEDFIEFHASLAHELMGNNPSNDSVLLKSLPHLPASLSKVDERAASQRRADLDLYLRQLSTCSEQILRSAPVRGFLELRPGDRCKTSVTVSKPRIGRRSASESPNHSEFDLASRLQGLTTGSNPRRYSPSESLSPTMSSKRSSEATLPMDSAPYFRVKVVRRDDPERILAVRMPPNFSYQYLLQKIQDRLGSDLHVLQPDEQRDGMTIINDDDVHAWMHTALTSGQKLFLYADK